MKTTTTDTIVLHAIDTAARDATVIAMAETIIALAHEIAALARERQIETLMRVPLASRLVH